MPIPFTCTKARVTVPTATTTAAYHYLQWPAKIITTRLLNSIAEKFLTETQCGFHPGRSTVDMISTAGQLQEKCREQQKDI